ncbi:MAG: hypothetical protein ABIJ96_14655 [Elusimicrobiota bacterium]
MGVEKVDEPVKVGAVFSGSSILPKWFVWSRRKYTVESVDMMWKGLLGDVPVRYFSVSDGANTYQLRLNQKTLEWRLERVHSR